jgi:hypothetical protein
LKNTLLIIFCIIIIIKSGYGQTNCAYPIDSAKIIQNLNLDDFLHALKSDSFKVTNNKKDIPKFIKKQLDCYTTNNFDIANPDQPYQSTDVIIERGLPRRKLTFLAKSSNVLVLCYNIGGIGVSSHLILIRFNNHKIIDLWKGICRTEISRISDVSKYLVFYREKNLRKHDDYIYF